MKICNTIEGVKKIIEMLEIENPTLMLKYMSENFVSGSLVEHEDSDKSTKVILRKDVRHNLYKIDIKVDNSELIILDDENEDPIYM